MNNNHIAPVETLFEKVEDYGKKTIELIALNAVDKSADVVSSLAIQLSIALSVTMFAFIANIGIAFWIGEMLGVYYFGFFAVALFYIFMTVILYIFRKQWIKIPVSNAIISQMLRQKIEQK